MSQASASGTGAPEPGATAIDLLLGQGEADALAQLRADLDRDPLATLAMAETVTLVERFRELRVAPGSAYAGKLERVLQRAARRVPTPRPSRWPGALWSAAAAFAAFVGLRHVDPFDLHRPTTVEWIRSERAAESAAAVAGTPATPEWGLAVDRMRQRLDETGAVQLRQALELGLQPGRDELSRWIDPRNAMAWLRLDHELRANATRRWQTMLRHGGLPAADERAQQIASGLAAQLPGVLLSSPSPHTVGAVALAVRALVATGADPARSAALARAGDWLATQCEQAQGSVRIAALGALVELAAIRESHRAAVARVGTRLVDDVLRCDAETWQRRLPELLGNSVEAAVLGEVGRLLARLPAFGVDGGRCELVRQLCLGQLRSRCAAGATAETLAGMVYGYADLLPEPERADYELQLQRWKPVRLLPDFVTVQQLAWAIEPGRRGFTRLQSELRQLAVCPTPAAFAERAAFCLCLAKDYAAFGPSGASIAGS